MGSKKIAIIGGGAAGLSAAVTAAELGGQAEIFEALKITGGNGQFAEGVFGAGSRLQRRLGIYADPDEIFRYAMSFSHWRSDAALTRALIDASAETVDWLCSEGVPFSRVIHHMTNQSPELFHMTAKSPTGKAVVDALTRRCRELNVAIHTGCRIASIERSETGAICGLTDENGNHYDADTILIATGGFAGNNELLRKMIPGICPENILHFRGIRFKGDGLLMAEAVGASIEKDIAIEGAGPVFVLPSPINAIVRSAEALWVNIEGKRFADESICEDFVCGFNALARQPEQRCWALFDENIITRAMAAPPAPMAEPDCDDNGLSLLPDALTRAIEKGAVVCAGSIAELAAKTGLDPVALGATVSQYNKNCLIGADSEFAKPRRFMQPLDGQALYAAKAQLDMLTTHGGITIDSRMRVLDTKRSPIPGLYAAGVDVSGIDSADYSVLLCGHAFGFALAGGRLAAKDILSNNAGD